MVWKADGATNAVGIKPHRGATRRASRSRRTTRPQRRRHQRSAAAVGAAGAEPTVASDDVVAHDVHPNDGGLQARRPRKDGRAQDAENQRLLADGTNSKSNT